MIINEDIFSLIRGVATSRGFYLKTMGKHSKPNIGQRKLLDSSNEFYQDLLGYKPEQTSLQSISPAEWGEFAQSRGLNPNSSGVYFPRNQTAIVKGDNPLSLFHEYFGHGLYCEQSLPGKKLVLLEKKLLKEEKREFSGKKFDLTDVQKFREHNKIFHELDGLRKQNLMQYELFAIWTEFLLSEENSFEGLFNQKYDSLQGKEREALDRIIDFGREYGNLAAFYAQGMARRTTPERVKRLLEGVYREKLRDVEFALLYGSKKEFSDVDVFMVGRNPLESHSNFLDVKMKSKRDIQNGVKNFDVRIINPLMTGEFIFGNEVFFKELKKQYLSQCIEERAIKHNLKWHFRAERLAEENAENSFLVKKFKGYSKTYLANALALREGKRLFTKEELLSYSLDGGYRIERRYQNK